jgi:hypothetical protein
MRTVAVVIGMALLAVGCGAAAPPDQDGTAAATPPARTAPAPQGTPPFTAPGTPLRTSSPDHQEAPGYILHHGPWDTDARRRTLAELRAAGRSSAGGADVDALVFVDGKRLPRGSNLADLPVQDLKVIMGGTAFTTFGQRARGGVLIVTTKDTTGGH